MQKESAAASQSLYLTRVLFHVAALFRVCARFSVEFQRLDTDDPQEIRRLYYWFYSEFAAHDELLSALRAGRFSNVPLPTSHLMRIVLARLAVFDQGRDKFLHRERREGDSWFVRIDYDGAANYVLPLLGLLQELEEILFQALTLGSIAYATNDIVAGT